MPLKRTARIRGSHVLAAQRTVHTTRDDALGVQGRARGSPAPTEGHQAHGRRSAGGRRGLALLGRDVERAPALPEEQYAARQVTERRFGQSDGPDRCRGPSKGPCRPGGAWEHRRLVTPVEKYSGWRSKRSAPGPQYVVVRGRCRANTGQIRTKPVEPRTQLCPLFAPLGLRRWRRPDLLRKAAADERRSEQARDRYPRSRSLLRTVL